MWLTIRTGDERGRSVPVEREQFLIGRELGCDLTLHDSKMSRQHASIVRLQDGAVELRDLGSSNGTFVNGERVGVAPLRGGEQVQFGDTVLATSLEKPGRVSGSTVLGSLPRSLTGESAVHRLVLQRSVRRATVLGIAAIVVAASIGVLFATNVLPPGSGQELTAVQRVVRHAAAGTVLVEAQRDGRRVGAGTGWVLDGAEGLVVTNAHVLNGGSTFRIGVPEGFASARIVGLAPCEDLAVLRVRGAPGLRSMTLGWQAGLELGQPVVAVGYPEAASHEASLTSTTGVVSVVRSAYREPSIDVPRYPNVIQTDAAINPGNSGGPLLDLRGRLIGVNSVGRTVSIDGRIIQGQNYAIGVDRVRSVTTVLRTGRSIGWTGVSFDHDVTMPRGLHSAAAVAGTAAERAALGAPGTVLVAIDGLELDNTLASYCDAVAGLQSGQRATFTVLRPGASQAQDVRLRLE